MVWNGIVYILYKSLIINQEQGAFKTLGANYVQKQVVAQYINYDEKTIQSDNVVVSGDRQPRKDAAMKFYGLAEQFFIIGDCVAAGFLPAVCRTAYAAISQI